ncbi:MAG TPA: peptidoglycan-binding domain-containing protein [Rhodopila sp.]|nr:peptidoglycan-binding domain-containing protein [Rhodopila sp.]
MKRFAMLAAGALAAASIHPAHSQPVPPLTYIQPVPPAAVQTVQSRLHTAGDYTGVVDGVWGQDSAAALQRFQAEHQLQATGQLNQATAAALGIDPAILLGVQQGSLAPTPPPPPDTLQAASVRAVQERLHTLGFYNGSIDGIWGAGTQNAVQQFQQNRGLQPNGQLTQATVGALGLPPDSLAYR